MTTVDRYVANIFIDDTTAYADIAAEEFGLPTERAVVLVTCVDCGNDVAAAALERPLWRRADREWWEEAPTYGARAEAMRALAAAGWRVRGRWHNEGELIRADVVHAV